MGFYDFRGLGKTFGKFGGIDKQLKRDVKTYAKKIKAFNIPKQNGKKK